MISVASSLYINKIDSKVIELYQTYQYAGIFDITEMAQKEDGGLDRSLVSNIDVRTWSHYFMVHGSFYR